MFINDGFTNNKHSVILMERNCIQLKLHIALSNMFYEGNLAIYK